MDRFFADIQARIRAFMARAAAEADLRSTDAEFAELALALFELQRARNPAYASFCGQRKIGAVGDWREIPAVPTTAFKQLEMTSLFPGERTDVFFSSGTTQQDRSRHFHSHESMEVYDESARLWFNRRFGAEFQDARWMILTPPWKAARNSSLAHMFSNFAAEREDTEFFGALDSQGVWTLEAARVVDALRAAREPVALFGTAFLFIHLLDHLASEGVQLKLPTGSWILETGGYKGRSRVVPKEEFRRLLRDQLGISEARIFGEYGMSELSSQAYDRGDGNLQFPPWARALMISPATGLPVKEGEPGLIRVLDLANIWSVMAVQTEDVGVQVGDGFELRGRSAQAEARGCSLLSV